MRRWPRPGSACRPTRSSPPSSPLELAGPGPQRGWRYERRRAPCTAAGAADRSRARRRRMTCVRRRASSVRGRLDPTTSRITWRSNDACRPTPSPPTAAIWCSWLCSSRAEQESFGPTRVSAAAAVPRPAAHPRLRARIGRPAGRLRSTRSTGGRPPTGRVAEDPSVLLGRPKVVNRLPTVLRPREAAELAEAPSPPAPRRRTPDPADRAVALRDRGGPRAPVRLGPAGRRGRGPHGGPDRPGSRARPGLGKGSRSARSPCRITPSTLSRPTWRRAAGHRPRGRPRTLLQQEEERPSAHAISVRWWNDMAVQCCRADG